MKHAWQERADGTAWCRRCPAVRAVVRKQVGTKRTLEHDRDGSPYYRDEPIMAQAVEVTYAHPSKCRPGQCRDSLTPLAIAAADGLMRMYSDANADIEAAARALDAVARECFTVYGPASAAGNNALGNAGAVRRDGHRLHGNLWAKVNADAWRVWATAEHRNKAWPW